MAALTEQEIIDIVYSLYEGDTEYWDADSDEYLTARKYANLAISRWERYDNTVWNELFTNLTSSPDGTKTLTSGVYTYSCPTNFIRPSSWVRTGNTPTFWKVISPARRADYDGINTNVCWFSGNVKDGFKLNFNDGANIPNGDSINYEYYKQATTFTSTTSTTEMGDPYFIVYYILYRLLKTDGEDYSDEFNQAGDILESMRVANMSSLVGVDNPILGTINNDFGFGV